MLAVAAGAPHPGRRRSICTHAAATAAATAIAINACAGRLARAAPTRPATKVPGTRPRAA